MNVIEINHLSKDYGNHKGIFDVSFHIKKGEVFGFLGPNGAGKTTTIRHLMGFIKAQQGSCFINAHNCETESVSIQEKLGYIPGEISFAENMSGIEFIHFIARYRGLSDMRKANELIKTFELDPKGKIKKMSKGMKQKIGIVCAFMHDPDVLILDEPTSGLDPLMQSKFIDLVLKEKQKGKTILMSSHIFEEVEKTCDRVGIIKEGQMVSIETIDSLRQSKTKHYQIGFKDEQSTAAFMKESLTLKQLNNKEVEVLIKNDLNHFIQCLSKYDIDYMETNSQSLEEVFMHFYGGNPYE
ncbi:MAG: ABC transporter ATP-binding protein [Erysipelotrichaceae bacterium]